MVQRKALNKRILTTTLPTTAIFLVAFALRVWGLADLSLWWDEGWSASLARKPIMEIIRFVAYDNHPPLHNIIMRGWWLLVGDGEFVLRYPSVLFGFLWVALAYRLGGMLGKRRTARLGALLLALSRFAIVWSQQVRMYTWSAMWVTLVLISTLSFWRRQRWQALLMYVISAAAILLSLYLTVSALITVNLVFLGFVAPPEKTTAPVHPVDGGTNRRGPAGDTVVVAQRIQG